MKEAAFQEAVILKAIFVGACLLSAAFLDAADVRPRLTKLSRYPHLWPRTYTRRVTGDMRAIWHGGALSKRVGVEVHSKPRESWAAEGADRNWYGSG